MESLGYQYEAAPASFALIVRKATRTFTPHFKRIRYRVEVAGYGGSGHNTYAAEARRLDPLILLLTTTPCPGTRHRVTHGLASHTASHTARLTRAGTGRGVHGV